MAGNEFEFSLCFPNCYPFKAPTVFLLPAVSDKHNQVILDNYSHLIDFQSGKVLLPIFTTDWNAVLDFSMIVFELQMFVSSPDQVSHHEAIKVYDMYYSGVRDKSECEFSEDLLSKMTLSSDTKKTNKESFQPIQSN